MPPPLRRVFSGALALALGLLAGCAAPLGGEDFTLAVGPAASPGLGLHLSGAQRMYEGERFDLSAEVGFVQQALRSMYDDRGRCRDSGWSQALFGFQAATHPRDGARWIGRAGVTWLRAMGDPVFLDEPGDYGGFFVGLGYERRIGEHLSTGPDLTLLGLLPEGSGSGGVMPQLAWRIIWHL